MFQVKSNTFWLSWKIKKTIQTDQIVNREAHLKLIESYLFYSEERDSIVWLRRSGEIACLGLLLLNWTTLSINLPQAIT